MVKCVWSGKPPSMTIRTGEVLTVPDATVPVATTCTTPDLIPELSVMIACPTLFVVTTVGERNSPPPGPLAIVNVSCIE
jgi:hypothetical protein